VQHISHHLITLLIFLIVLLIIISLAFLLYIASPKQCLPITYITFSGDKTYLKPLGWKGVPIDKKKRFVNYEYPFYQNYLTILYWLPGNFINQIKHWGLMSPIEVHESNEFLLNDDTLIWLGHASFFLRVQGVNILIDPQFYNTFPYKRHTNNPILPELFTSIKYILISHNHADHCDKKSLQLLVKNNPGVIILSGLKMDELIQPMFKQKVIIKEAEWYERFSLEDAIEIFFVPSRHYSHRLLKKYNQDLWGGFILKFKTKANDYRTIYFAGDSGYGSHFKDIKSIFEIDIAMLGIGAYKPKWFMHPNHISPKDAIRAATDLNAKLMIPMHFETYNLSNEKMSAPRKYIEENSDSQTTKLLIPGEEYKLM
jgi:L-ascorbate metabolism protein UlaG (beta-lactamase superfamily)